MSANLSDIERLGLCDKCKQWLPLKKGQGWLPDHKGADGKKCSNSKYSYDALKHNIKTLDEAVAVAQFILGDEGGCLNGGGLHSLACGDGDYCENERLLWAQALAEYFLANRD